MPWPTWILQGFEAIPGGVDQAADESLLYGPYNNLLFHLFPPQEGYIIAPQYRQPPEKWSIDFAIVFVVQRENRPIFFLEIKPGPYLRTDYSRANADRQMRECFLDLHGFVPALRYFYGISALGTRLSLYIYDVATRELIPHRIEAHSTRLNDLAPADRWNINLLSEEGVARVTALAEEIKQMVVALCTCSSMVGRRDCY